MILIRILLGTNALFGLILAGIMLQTYLFFQ
jgi:hypothetical protein